MSTPTADTRHPMHNFDPTDWRAEDAWSALVQWRSARNDYLRAARSWPTGPAGFRGEDFAAEARLTFTAGG
jgi:hypothetical protein